MRGPYDSTHCHLRHGRCRCAGRRFRMPRSWEEACAFAQFNIWELSRAKLDRVDAAGRGTPGDKAQVGFALVPLRTIPYR